MAQREFRQIYPQPGWVEHDPKEIWAAQLATAREALAKAGLRRRRHRRDRHHQPARDHGAVEPQHRRAACTTPSSGRTGAPSRPAPRCASAASSRLFRAKTGLVIDAYFSGTKLQWLLDNVPGARAAAAARRAGLRHRRQLADVAADRRRACTPPTSATPRARCCSTCTATRGTTSCWRCSTSRARCCREVLPSSHVFGDTAGRAARRRDPDRRRGRRPAERAVRPGLLQRRAWRRTPTAPAASC